MPVFYINSRTKYGKNVLVGMSAQSMIMVEIHHSKWKIEPNVNLFSQQQQTTGDKVIPMHLSCY